MERNSLRRLALVLFAAVVMVGFATATSGCAHPYSGKPEKLKKPRKKKKPEPTEEEKAAEEVVWDEECRANFFDDKKPAPRKSRAAATLTRQADQILLAAEDQGGAQRIESVVEAISKLKNALKKDQFNPEATYKLAVAYAMVLKKGCALRLLERLNELQKKEDVSRKAELTIKRATKDLAFEGFRKDADAAMGQ